MGNPSAKRKRPEGKGFRKPEKKFKNFKKQKSYHSSSEEEDETNTDFKPVNMDDSDDEDGVAVPARVAPKLVKKSAPKAASKPAAKPAAEASPKPALKSALKKTQKVDPPSSSEDDDAEDEEDAEEDEDDDDEGIEDLNALDDVDINDDDLGSDMDDDEVDLSGEDSGAETGKPAKTRKRNDPTAFANSMSKILNTKLTTAKRQDPVLSRSAAATAASKELTDAKLEAKARRQLHAEKRQALEKGRVKDVLGFNTPDVSTAEIQDREQRLKKTAQRGVVKLFNAVRAAQVKGEQARQEAKKEGVVGVDQREERVTEMTKKGFLDLIASGGKKAAPAVPQEA